MRRKRLAGILAVILLLTGCGTGKIDRMLSGMKARDDRSPRVVYSEKSDVAFDASTGELLLRVQEMKYVSHDVARYTAITTDYWNEASNSGISRREDLLKNARDEMVKTYALVRYAEEKDPASAEREKEEIDRMVKQIQDGKIGQELLRYLEMYGEKPSKEVLADFVKVSLSTVRGAELLRKNIPAAPKKTDEAISMYEVLVPVKHDNGSATEDERKTAEESARKIAERLKAGEPVLKVAKEFEVAAFPSDYTGESMKSVPEKAAYLKTAFALREGEVTEPMPIFVAGSREPDYYLVGKVAEKNTERLKKRLAVIQGEQAGDAEFKKKLQELTSDVIWNEEFFQRLEFKMNPMLIKHLTESTVIP